MKKKALTMAALIILCTGFVFAQNGVIKEITGTVEIKRAGSAAFVPARAGDQLAWDTIVSTGFKSTAVIEVGGAVINVRPVTRLTLTEISALDNEESLQMNLRAGSVHVAVNPPSGKRATMTIQSPTATASVRGTDFYFDTRNLRVTQGAVLFKGKRGYTVQAGAGTATAVVWNGTASAPQSATAYQDLSLAGWDPSAATGGKRPASSGPGFADVGVEY